MKETKSKGHIYIKKDLYIFRGLFCLFYSNIFQKSALREKKGSFLPLPKKRLVVLFWRVARPPCRVTTLHQALQVFHLERLKPSFLCSFSSWYNVFSTCFSDYVFEVENILYHELHFGKYLNKKDKKDQYIQVFWISTLYFNKDIRKSF